MTEPWEHLSKDRWPEEDIIEALVTFRHYGYDPHINALDNPGWLMFRPEDAKRLSEEIYRLRDLEH